MARLLTLVTERLRGSLRALPPNGFCITNAGRRSMADRAEARSGQVDLRRHELAPNERRRGEVASSHQGERRRGSWPCDQSS